jgi:hypothetical protein
LIPFAIFVDVIEAIHGNPIGAGDEYDSKLRNVQSITFEGTLELVEVHGNHGVEEAFRPARGRLSL